MNITPIKVGCYINFTTQRVVTDLSGARKYLQEKYTGQVIAINSSTLVKTFKVKIRNKQEYHEVVRYNITHVWYTV